MAEACPDYVNAEKVILLMDTAQGFINHSAKAFIERTIPHYHPYIEIVDIERFQLQPAKEQEKILAPFVKLVGSVLENGQMSAPLLAKLADPEYLSKGPLFLFKLVAPTGLIQFYWDRQLKQNKAFQQRFDQPYYPRPEKTYTS